MLEAKARSLQDQDQGQTSSSHVESHQFNERTSETPHHTATYYMYACTPTYTAAAGGTLWRVQIQIQIIIPVV